MTSYLEDQNKHSNSTQILYGLFKSLTSRMHVSKVELGDSFSADVLFESMNNRGRQLKQTDLIKSIIISRAQKEGIHPAVLEQWQRLLEPFPNDDPAMFLRIYLQQKNKRFISGKLSRAIRNDVDAAAERNQNTKEYMHQLNQILTDYSSYVEDFTQKHNQKDEISLKLKTIALLPQTAVFHTFLLQVFRKLNVDQKHEFQLYVNCIDAIESYSLRNYITKKDNPSEIQKLFAEMMQTVSHNHQDGIPEAIRNLVRQIPKEGFLKQFSTFKVDTVPICKHILMRIESKKRARTEPLSSSTRKITLEHIMPKNYTNKRGWTSKFTKASHKKYLWRLGNLTLLAAKLNWGDDPFRVKKEKLYKHSHVLITKELLEFDDWRANQIKSRQEQLASFAESVWPTRIDV